MDYSNDILAWEVLNNSALVNIIRLILKKAIIVKQIVSLTSKYQVQKGDCLRQFNSLKTAKVQTFNDRQMLKP